jgi:hypothetical protein
MARLTLESIIREIWYESWGLHLIGAPLHILVDSVGLGQNCSALGQSHQALSKLFQTRQNTWQLCQKGKV